ncbi:hypothetical protein XELAEV_18002298mg [Xenopus laevis]|nr:hypothetical protein XELAEV_18002298mg [Xenopus laevis]
MSQHGSYSHDSTTFVYTEADAIHILGQEQSNNLFLTEPTGENIARKLEKEKRCLTGMELHSITLKENYKSKRIPRGLRINLRITIFQANTDFVKRYEQIVNKCSFDILEYLQNTIPEVILCITEQQLKSTLRTEEVKTSLPERRNPHLALETSTSEEATRLEHTGGPYNENTSESSTSSSFLDYSPPRHAEDRKGATGTNTRSEHHRDYTSTTEWSQQPTRTARKKQEASHFTVIERKSSVQCNCASLRAARVTPSSPPAL